MARIGLEVYAKVNLGLAVLAKRPDGYHDIDTVFQTVSLSDTVELESRPEGAGVSLQVAGAAVPAGPSNLAWKGASAVIDRTGCPGVAIALEKRIPVAAGLAGGSADAAAVLVGMNELFTLGLGLQELRAIGLTVGSDVPFLIRGGTARGRGRGEVIDQLPALRGAWFVLVTPQGEVAAASAYRRAGIGLTGSGESIRLNCSAIQDGDVRRLAGGLRNDLEAGVVLSCPDVAAIKKRLMDLGALGAVMSGSGPTVVGVTDNEGAAADLAAGVSGPGMRVHVVEPTDAGCRVTHRDHGREED
jgi:4-diphosphocytidyl-2-C-methyl-D-erythritol kinase